MLDDPVLLANILPFTMSMQPKFLRWGICSQEYCFNPKLPGILQAFFGSGNVMPIKRGGGINQKLFFNFAHRVAAGEWCHIFPEGGIWQRNELGGRENGTENQFGRFKWGVGKLIAHSPQRPRVIPFFHHGMETVLPQDPLTKVLLTKYPIPGQKVHVIFGKEIVFDDLIAEHEALYGPLWTYSPSSHTQGGDFHAQWDSKPSDRHIYHKITMRIEDSLRQLNEESNAILAIK